MLRQLSRIMSLTEEEIMSHPTMMVNIFDHEHRVLYWNKRCEDFFGIPEEEALGKRLEDLVPQAGGHRNMMYLDKALAGQSNIIEQIPYERREGCYMQVFLPLKNHKGKVIAAVSIVRDIVDSAEQNALCWISNKTSLFDYQKNFA